MALLICSIDTEVHTLNPKDLFNLRYEYDRHIPPIRSLLETKHKAQGPGTALIGITRHTNY